MRWRGERGSSNIEDRRGMRLGGGGKFTIGGVLLGLVALYFTNDPTMLLQSLSVEDGGGTQQSGEYQETSAEAESRQLVAVVLADTETAWTDLFSKMGRQYEYPTLVLFNGAVQSACGSAQSAMGPFYCPGDRKVYIDLSFYDELKNRFGAPGDFARAYVVAHEVGHHVQNLLGTAAEVRRAQQQGGESEANALSVRLELQADCYAGIWAHYTDKSRGLLEAGDVEAGLNAASAIGDDTLQRSAGRSATPDSFTHGSSEQRVRWFKRGIDSGDVAQCDTFKSRSL